MTAKYHQIALNDIFSDFQSKLIDNYPLSLFFFQNTLISMNLFHPSSIRLSGFSKVPDTSLLSRFKHNFDAYIELMFQRMVDHTEPICQLIHVSLSQTSIVIPLSIHSTTQVETLQACKPSTKKGLSIHSTTQVETYGSINTGWNSILSIHSTTQVETTGNINPEDIEDLSIHSTTQVETKKISKQIYCIDLSIHSTTQVETLFRCSLYPATFPFNPLHHTGGDVDRRRQRVFDRYLSIHSTTQVETRISRTLSCTISSFNPLHHTGGDCYLIDIID